MATTIITPEDLQLFKEELLFEIRKLLTEEQTAPARKWLKSIEVMRLLRVSRGTLTRLRVTGTLPFTKIRGVIFYDYDDIRKMILEHKDNLHFTSKKVKP